MFEKMQRRPRRGFSAVQWMLIAAVVTVVILASVQLIGRQSKERLEETNTGVGDPSQLKNMLD